MGIRYCVIDTEGSGLFQYKDDQGRPVPADAPGQPRLAELAMLLLNEDLSVQEEWRGLVKPDGWTMHPDATAVNGLTTEYLLEHGKPVVEVLEVYEQVIREGYCIAAFNAQHDCKTMRAELRRAGRDDLFLQTKNVCLMRKSNGPIPKRGGKKGWPSLEEARDFLHIPHDGAHRAGADTASALVILRYLHAFRFPDGSPVDLTPEVHFAKIGGKPDETLTKTARVTVDPASIVDANPLHGAKVSRPRSPALPPRESQAPRSAALPPRDVPLADQEIPE